MKLHLILVLFIAALVAVPCFAEEVAPDNDEPLVNGGQALADEDQSGPPENGNKGDEEADEEDTEQDQSGPPENGNKGDEEADEEGAEQDEEEIKNHPNLPEEIKDEVKDAVKRRVLLSARCCLVLKRYKFCRNSIIRRLCYRQCRPPVVCKNLISPRSCLLVRNKFRRCRHNIGRVYCRYTCGYCRPPKRRWVTSTPYWCGHRNRRLMTSRISLKKCQALCLRRRGCNAVEWWGKYNFNCYQCLNYRLMKRYSNTRDLAWPPYVSRYI